MMERMASSASDQQESEEQATTAADGRRSTKSEEKPDETDLRASLDTLRDLFAEAFPGDDEISQVTRVARDLKNDDTASAPDAEQNAQYADTIEWLRDEGKFDDESSFASTTISRIIRCRAEAVLEEELDYWAYVLVHFARSRGFLLDARLAKVWLCGNMTGIVKDMLEKRAGVALGAGHTLTNIARAGGTSQPNVRTKWPHIREYADAYRMTSGSDTHGTVTDNRSTASDSSDDKKYMQRAKRIMEMRDRIIADTSDNVDSDDADQANRGMGDTGLLPEQRMCVGMEAVIGLMHTEHGMNLDFDKVNDVLSQGDRMWVGIGESYAENAAEEAMRAAVSMLFDEAGTSVQGLLGSLSGPYKMDIAQLSKVASIPCSIWKDAQYAWGMKMDDDGRDGAVRVVLIAVGSAS